MKAPHETHKFTTKLNRFSMSKTTVFLERRLISVWDFFNFSNTIPKEITNKTPGYHRGISHPLTLFKSLSILRQNQKRNKTYRTVSKEDSRILRSPDNKTAKCFGVGSQKLDVTEVMKIAYAGHFTASVGDSLPKCDAQKEGKFCRETWSSSHFSQKFGRRKMQFSSLQIVQQNLTPALR